MEAILLIEATVPSPMAAGVAVNFNSESRSGGGVVVASGDRPPASISSVEQGVGFLPQRGRVFLCMRRSF